MNEITQKIINELHSVVAQRTADEAYYLLDQVIAEAQDLQCECLKMMEHLIVQGDEEE